MTTNAAENTMGNNDKTVRTRRKKVEFVALEGKASDAERAAYFLDWAAENTPGQYYTAGEVAYYAKDLSTMPRSNSKEIPMMKGRYGRIKEILREQYRKGWEANRDFGVRALSDVNLITEIELVRNTQRLDGARKSVTKTLEIIGERESQFANTDRGRRLKSFASKVRGTVKQLPALDDFTKLLPPKE